MGLFHINFLQTFGYTVASKIFRCTRICTEVNDLPKKEIHGLSRKRHARLYIGKKSVLFDVYVCDLMLNGSKTETIMIGTTVQLKSADAATTTVSIAGASLPISKELKSLGVILDDHLCFDSHVRAAVKACAYHTHALRHVRHLLTTELATTIACSIVATRLDYCNSLLYGAPEATLDKFRRAQNNLARVVTCSARRSNAKPLLESLLASRSSTLHLQAGYSDLQGPIDRRAGLSSFTAHSTCSCSFAALRQCEEADCPSDKNGHRQSRFLHRSADRVERSPG